MVLAYREVVRFFRQRSRVMGAILSPVIFWLLLGYGFGSSFKSNQVSGYEAYFFPGILLMVLMFTSIFSMISLIEDRKEGFLQSVLVAPVSPYAIVFGKVLGTSVIATAQMLLVSLLAPVAGLRLGAEGIMLLLVLGFVVSANMSLFGFALAWRSTSVQGFHVLMNLILMPMWLLSGATFPVDGASRWIAVMMTLNPMTYSNKLLQGVFFPGSIGVPLLITILTGVLFLGVCVVEMRVAHRVAV